METENQQFKIFLPGLLEVLAENLYSDNRVAIRELLQNAHDSCVRRTVEGKDPNFKARVDMSVDAAKHQLTIRDNGSGLTRDEIHNYLSTIGRSYTRQLGEDLAILSPDKAQLLIGQFGLGFLSAFFIASDVTVITRSMQEGSETLRWHSVGDGNYAITTSENSAIGTTIHLTLKTNVFTLIDQTILEETVRKYADFLPIPVYLDGKSKPINRMVPPWEEKDVINAISQYIAHRFQVQNPICVIRLEDHIINLGHDTLKIPLKGFLFIPSGSVASVHEYGDLTVYIRHMFISEGPSALLPPWARFVRGVIDSSQLQPTASREQVQQNEFFDLVKRAIGEQLTAALRYIAQHQKNVWRTIVRGHRSLIIIWADKDDEFFREVADIVTFRTSRGILTLPEYLELSGDTLYYTERPIGSLQDQIISESLKHPVINAAYFGEARFIAKYAEYRHLNITLLDEKFDQLFVPVSENETHLLSLRDHIHEKGVTVELVRFDPAVLPAIIVYPTGLEFIEETRDALDTGHLPELFAQVINDYVSEIEQGERIQATLYLNASNTLIQQLADISDPSTRQAMLLLVYQTARLLNGRLLNTAKTNQAFRSITDQLTTFITA